MASLKWVKISLDLFSDERISLLETESQGERHLLLWFRLLLLAGKLNNGGAFILDGKPLTPQRIAAIIKKKPSYVASGMAVLCRNRLIFEENGLYFIPNWDKHQSEDKLEKIRENARLRQQAFRERHRAKQAEPSRDSNVTVTPQNKKENQNQNEMIIMNNNNPPFSYAEPTQPLSVANDLCVEPEHPLPPALTQTVTAFCEGLTEGDNPSDTHTLLLAWLSSLKEKNRLPTTEALPLLLAKLPQTAKESGMNFPDYLREAICRGWNNFYPVPTFGKSASTPPPRNKSYNIDELEAMI